VMQDTLIFPNAIEQVGTKELIYSAFPLVIWADANEPDYFVSKIFLDIAPVAFFEWAYQIPAGGHCPILHYCVDLSTQFLAEPEPWMEEVVMRLKLAPKRLTDGNPQ
jgi:hypothetical protein